MFLPKVAEFAVRKALALALGLVALLAIGGFAQDTTSPPPKSASQGVPPLTPLPQAPAPQNNAHVYSDQNYSQSKSAFPNLYGPYMSRRVPPPNLTNSARTDQLFRDGDRKSVV